MAVQLACVCTGTKYSDDYVVRLYNGAKRHLKPHFHFNLFTDRALGCLSSIENLWVHNATEQGYWNKILLFKPNQFPRGDTILYLDLDVLVTGSLNALLNFYRGGFAIMEDSICPPHYNSSVMMWRAGDPTVERIYTRWIAEGKPTESQVKHSKGDQAWIEHCFSEAKAKSDRPYVWPQNLVAPYYSKGQDLGYTTETAHTKKIDWWGRDAVDGASLVVFHGAPRFHELDLPMVAEHWI